MALSKKLINKNKNSQFDHHVQCILKSGVMLDEDMDVVLNQYNAENDNSADENLTMFQKLLGAFSLTSTMYILQRRYWLRYLTLTATPFIIIGFQRLRLMLHRKNQKRNMEQVVETTYKISKLNRMVYEYFRLRIITDPATVSIINPYTKGMKQLIETIFKEEVNLLYAFRIFVRHFGTFVPSLKEDYAYLDDLEFDDFSTSNVQSINDCVKYLQKLSDVYILVVSNCLTCLAVTLCPNIWTKYNINIDEILDTVVPKMKKISSDCYDSINKKFDDLKYHYINKNQIKKQFKKPKPSTATKLQISTYNTMVHTSEILEKSQIIFKKLQQVDLQSLSEKEKLGRCISELRAHVFDYYESLDILYKLYEVNINACQRKPVFNNHFEVKEETNPTIVKVMDAALNCSEPSDDETYELYIGANESSSESTNYSLYEEQESRKFASLLSQELKGKLKAHAQFVAARKKRGIIDEVLETPQTKTKKAVPVEKVEIEVLPNYDNMKCQNLVPPPLPPPLPPIDLGPYGNDDESSYTVNDFLESIKAASKNRHAVEEVFLDTNNE